MACDAETVGNWHTIYMRLSRWAHNGVLERVFQQLQQQQLINLEVLGLDSTTVKVHPDGCGPLKKRGPQSVGRSRGGLTTKIHMIAADARTAVGYTVSPGQDHDAPHGRNLLKTVTKKTKMVGEQLQLALGDCCFIHLVGPVGPRVLCLVVLLWVVCRVLNVLIVSF